MSRILELAKVVGKKAEWIVEGLRVEVQILDVRKVWNRIDYLCKPVSGQGEKWISEERIVNFHDA